MAIQFLDVSGAKKVLFVDGAIAMDPACCCEEESPYPECDPCQFDYSDAFPETIAINISGLGIAAGCAACSSVPTVLICTPDGTPDRTFDPDTCSWTCGYSYTEEVGYCSDGKGHTCPLIIYASFTIGILCNGNYSLAPLVVDGKRSLVWLKRSCSEYGYISSYCNWNITSDGVYDPIVDGHTSSTTLADWLNSLSFSMSQLYVDCTDDVTPACDVNYSGTVSFSV